MKEKFYTLDKILEHNADYNMIYGERSNGKTTSVLKYALIDFVDSGYNNQLAIIRRWDTDFKGNSGKSVFEGVVKLGWVIAATVGKYNSVYYFAQKWYLCKYDNDGNRTAMCEKPFALAFSINMEEHYKSTSYPDIKTILFDEFITRSYYLPDEFVKFQNLLSTIIRLRTDVKIFMCGNSINKYCPYFNEMGLRNVKTQKKGTIDIYHYGDSELKVAVEYSDFPAKKKESNKYFAFDNPKLQMITNGGWEIDIYPHLPHKYAPKDVLNVFYIVFDGEILQGNVILLKQDMFIYLHRKTTEIKEDNERLVYHQTPNYKHNYRFNFLRPYGKADTIIKTLWTRNKIFYQDNEVGEVMNNYIKWCQQN